MLEGLEESLLNPSVKSSLGLNCVVQHLSFLATGENSLGSFYVLSQARC